MKANPKQYAQALFEMVKEEEDKEVLEKKIKKFAKILIEFNQASKVNKILNYFSSLWNQEKGILEAEISSVHKLDEEVTSLLKDYIYKVSEAKEVNIKQKTNKKLLGGVVIKYGDKIVDNSLKQRVNKLKNSIK